MTDTFTCGVCHQILTAAANCPGSDILYIAQVETDGRTFSPGIAGTFVLRQALAPDTLVCNTCLKRIGFDPLLSIECGLCYQRYQECLSGQGWRCSTFFSRGRGYSSWGSRFDGDRYEVRDQTFEVNICDACVQRLLDDGGIVRVSESQHCPETAVKLTQKF